ncbi:Serine/threonine-protein kinase SRPK [Lonchura striata]|uniref:non-specific serine/threonine protein kinase n=1 Tax=Lonchura striata TaxID=40157 RepID=A0A218VBT8_9PASE|nr:Serine/threonine-protein kinase SRPK [Lonchura striata domestica]
MTKGMACPTPELLHGAHHPMQEGEVFNTQYQVLHKLGCGAFATVWLCQDMRRKKQVAVKVLKSRESFADTAQDEVAFLRCVLAGLRFLHECCRIIHADIKPENILLCGHSKSLQRLLMPTLDCDQGAEGKLKGAGGDLGNQLEESDLMSIEVKIADLGSACWTYKPFSKEIQTQPYRALEVLLGLDYGTPADIWSTACLVGLGTVLLPGILADRHGWTPQEAAAFAAFLLPALHYAPERRASAAQSLRHAWIAAP